MLEFVVVPEVNDTGLVALIMKSGKSNAPKVNVAVTACLTTPMTPVMVTG